MKLYWLDLETTGLTPHRDRILEIAVSVADLANPFAASPVFHRVFHLPPGETRYLDPFVLKMHTDNGLLRECDESTSFVGGAEQDLLKIVPEAVDKDDLPTVAGSTVHFDLAFLHHHMPRLAQRFSHRVYDVSAVKLFCRSLGMLKLPRAEAHRAKDDVLESLLHAQLCRDWLQSWGAIESKRAYDTRSAREAFFSEGK